MLSAILLTSGLILSTTIAHPLASDHESRGLTESLNYEPLESARSYAPLTRRRQSIPKISNVEARSLPFGQERTSSNEYLDAYNIEVKVDGVAYELVLDTRGADIWLIREGYTCLNATATEAPQGYCNFGKGVASHYPDGKIKNEHFNHTSSQGNIYTGDVGVFNISVSGIHIKNQTVGLINLVQQPRASFDTITSGVLGLAHHILTSAYLGNDPSLDNVNRTGSGNGAHVPYYAVGSNMLIQGLVSPGLFSLALERPQDVYAPASHGGYIAWGGVPPVMFDPIAFVSTPLLTYQFYQQPTNTADDWSHYTLLPESYVFTSNVNSTKIKNVYPALIDTVQYHTILPTDIYNAYLESIVPAPVVSNDPLRRGPFVPCNSTVPELGVQISGTIFNISSTDMIIPYLNYTASNGEKYCSLGVADAAIPLSGGAQIPILGTAFLQNVVALFDIGALAMRFAPHKY